MTGNHSNAINAKREPLKMPRRDWFRLAGDLVKVVDERLFVLASDNGQQVFVPVQLI